MASCGRSRPWRTYDPRLGVYRAQHLVPAAGGWLLDQVVVLGALLFREMASGRGTYFKEKIILQAHCCMTFQGEVTMLRMLLGRAALSTVFASGAPDTANTGLMIPTCCSIEASAGPALGLSPATEHRTVVI